MSPFHFRIFSTPPNRRRPAAGRVERLSAMHRLSLPLLALLLATPASADWLILRNGTRIETLGPWTEKGRQVVYTTVAERRLVSLRGSDVDLPASRQASASQPSAARRLYQDLGEAPDANNLPPPPKADLLGAWIKNPNAPRVSGTLSAPTLHVSIEDLIREGEQILADPEGTVNALAAEQATIAAQYQDCQAVNGRGSALCENAHEASDQALREKAWTAVAAVEAVRIQRSREAEAEAADQAETKRIEDTRLQEEKEAREAAEAEKADKEKAAKEAERAEKRAEEGGPPPRR
jgi:hypothetical protein